MWDEDFGQSCGTSGRTLLQTTRYSFDKVGNPTHSGAVVGTGNRLREMYGVHMEHDADGNVTRRYTLNNDGTLRHDERFHWNALSQLDSIRHLQPADCTARFGYDGWGRPSGATAGARARASCTTGTTC